MIDETEGKSVVTVCVRPAPNLEGVVIETDYELVRTNFYVSNVELESESLRDLVAYRFALKSVAGLKELLHKGYLEEFNKLRKELLP
jgi:hypothetical protein